jgi:hypothetical protein
MNTSQRIAAIDSEISRLQQSRELLVLTALREAFEPLSRTKPKRIMGADARARISAAQKKRWAKQKKVAK